MKQLDHLLKSSAGKSLYARSWQPETAPRAVVTLIHGFGEHCLRYTPYVEYFVNEGFAFLGFDLQGHGQSDGKRGCIKSYDSLLDDVAIAINKSADLFPDIPQMLYAHSMGANIGLNFLLRRKSPIKSAILSGPWLTLSKEIGPLGKLGASLIKNSLPNLTVNSNINPKFISTDEKEVAKYESDPLIHGKMSMLLFHHVTANGIWAMENTEHLKIPTLIMHGSDDKITSPKASKLAALNNEKYIEWLGWPGSYHEIHNEPNRNEVAQTAIDWFNKSI